MKVFNIQWDVDDDDIYDVIDKMCCHKAAAIFELSEDTYSRMSVSERHNYVHNYIQKNSSVISSIMELPDEAEIPDDIDEPADFLSDEYGFCINGFSIDRKKSPA